MPDLFLIVEGRQFRPCISQCMGLSVPEAKGLIVSNNCELWSVFSDQQYNHKVCYIHAHTCKPYVDAITENTIHVKMLECNFRLRN